jgi:soluble lytic murein transglycosylase-like protein
MGFNPDVMSGKINSPVGARGVAQFMPDTANWWAQQYGEFDPLVPEEAIPASGSYLESLYNQVGQDLPATYASYNWGVGNVKKALDRYGSMQKAYPHLPPETQRYLPTVMGDDWSM